MTTNQIAEALANTRKGQFFSVTIQRPAKVFKGVTDTIVKTTTVTAQNADYAARAAVREAVESGDREAPVLPSFVTNVVVIDGVKFWEGKNGFYLPVPVTNHGNPVWTRNGVEVKKEDISDLLLASEKSEPVSKDDLADKGQVPFIAVNVDNIIAIGAK